MWKATCADTCSARGGAMPVRRRRDGSDRRCDAERIPRAHHPAHRRKTRRPGACSSSIAVAWTANAAERVDAAMRLARRLGGEAEILRGHAVADELLAWANRGGRGPDHRGPHARTADRPAARLLADPAAASPRRAPGTHDRRHAGGTRAKARRRLRFADGNGSRREYAIATAATAVAMALSFVADRFLSVANLSLIFLAAVLFVAVRTRMAVAVFTAPALLPWLQLLLRAAPLHAGDRQRGRRARRGVVPGRRAGLQPARDATGGAKSASCARHRCAPRRWSPWASSWRPRPMPMACARSPPAPSRARSTSTWRCWHGTHRGTLRSPRRYPIPSRFRHRISPPPIGAKPTPSRPDATPIRSTVRACWVLPLGADGRRAGVVALRFPPDRASRTPTGAAWPWPWSRTWDRHWIVRGSPRNWRAHACRERPSVCATRCFRRSRTTCARHSPR